MHIQITKIFLMKTTCRDGNLKNKWERHQNTFTPCLHLMPLIFAN